MGWVNIPDASAQDTVTNFFLESPDRKISNRYVRILPSPDEGVVVPSPRLENRYF
jgi:hypothetical protein